jgi:hypothetical protein
MFVADLPARLKSSTAAPDPVDREGMTPLCRACNLGLAQVAIALLDGGASINLATPPSHNFAGFTSLMYAAMGNNPSVAKLLLRRGADGCTISSRATYGHAAGSTALDIARNDAGCADTLVVLRKRCCSTCGMTSRGRATKTAGEQTHLKRCSECPARGCRARYCDEVCQRADWVMRHRGECAEARRAREAAGTEF